VFIPVPDTTKNDVDTFQGLYPRYVVDLETFICPSTDNKVRSAADLLNNALGGRGDASGGHSYEIRGWTSKDVRFPDGRLFEYEVLKDNRRFKNQSRGCLIMDADDSVDGDRNNWPDSTNDNHGDKGLNVGFMDGHAAWVPKGRLLMEAYLEGYYDPGLDELYDANGVIKSGNTFSYK
jgi:prepilin-type processing-associated H-X9-DG protein